MDDVKRSLHVQELIANKLNLNTEIVLPATVTTVAGTEEANGTATVTISNLAPAGVGTATIKGWLKFTDSAGVVNYIPYWS